MRDNLSRVAARWRALQETQRAAWMAAAKEAMSNTRLGQNGPLSGFLLFTKINCTLAQFGQAQVDAPPARPQFPDLAPQNLVITNTAGVIALKLTCPTDPGENTIVRGSAPLSQGRETLQRLPDPRHVPGPRRRARPTSPASTRPGMACRRSARRCSSRSTSSLTGGKPARDLLGDRARCDTLTFRRGVLAIEQLPSPGFHAGRRPPRAPAREKL